MQLAILAGLNWRMTARESVADIGHVEIEF
jgi:hypothetical protein